MDYRLYLLTITFSVCLFSCHKNAEKQETVKVEVVAEIPPVDQDSIFCNKILTCILDESKNWPVAYTFERLDWKVADGKKPVDFNFVDGMTKEAHYYAKDKDNPFSKVEVNYYVFNDENSAKQILSDYRDFADEIVKDMSLTKGKIIGSRFIKMPNILYRQGSTVFHIVCDNGVKHIIDKALDRLEKENEIDKEAIAFF